MVIVSINNKKYNFDKNLKVLQATRLGIFNETRRTFSQTNGDNQGNNRKFNGLGKIFFNFYIGILNIVYEDGYKPNMFRHALFKIFIVIFLVHVISRFDVIRDRYLWVLLWQSIILAVLIVDSILVLKIGPVFIKEPMKYSIFNHKINPYGIIPIYVRDIILLIMFCLVKWLISPEWLPFFIKMVFTCIPASIIFVTWVLGPVPDTMPDNIHDIWNDIFMQKRKINDKINDKITAKIDPKVEESNSNVDKRDDSRLR